MNFNEYLDSKEDKDKPTEPKSENQENYSWYLDKRFTLEFLGEDKNEPK
jgi:hypothetical protein